MPTPVGSGVCLSAESQLAPITEEERAAWVKDDDLYAFYKDYVDNESAFEVLNAQAIWPYNKTSRTKPQQERGKRGLFGSLKPE